MATLAASLETVSSHEEAATCVRRYLLTLPGFEGAWFGFSESAAEGSFGWVLPRDGGPIREVPSPAAWEDGDGEGGETGGSVGDREEIRISRQGGSHALLRLRFSSRKKVDPAVRSELALLRPLLGLAILRLERLDLAERGQAQWEKVFDASSDLFVFHAHDGQVFRANFAVSSYLGRPITSIVGARCADLFPGVCAGHEAEAMEWTDPGTKRVFHVSTQVVGMGRETAVLHVLHEVTEQIRLQQLARQQDHMAFTARLLEGVAHEIRNPLFALSAVTQALERELGAEARAASHLGHILEQVRRMDSLVKRFLSISFSPPPGGGERAPARRVVEKTFALVRRRCSEGSAKRVAVVLEDESLQLPASDDSLAQALFDLLENALHFSPPDQRVELRVRRVGAGVELAVRDRGPGLSPEARERLFEPFFTTRPGRTGLGLAAAKAAMIRLGGTLELSDSPLLPGTTFLITLPV